MRVAAKLPSPAHGRGVGGEALRDRAREFRKHPTPTEALLWARLRNRQLEGLRFRRQHPIGRFIVDFICLEHRLIVEIDGGIHDTQVERDNERQAILEATGPGYRMIRVSSDDVQNRLNEVLERVSAAVYLCR